jgi:uncharacterized protein
MESSFQPSFRLSPDGTVRNAGPPLIGFGRRGSGAQTMDDNALLASLFEPAVLFFFLGLLVGVVRSNLEIPAQVTKFLSLYLLMAIGFKGGHAIAVGGFGSTDVALVGSAIVLALAIPTWSFLVLRRRIEGFDAAAIAATYGSVSAVTFIAATQFLAERGHAVSGSMTVALVLMESPAIVMAVLLSTWIRHRASVPARAPSLSIQEEARTSPSVRIRTILHEAFTDGAHLLLIGSLVIGAVSGERGSAAMAPFVDGLFKGLLAFFLLEMGLLVARQLREARDMTPFLVGFALLMPVVNALVAVALARVIGAGPGNATMLAVLAASASYIVVPAVVRYAIPEARPSRYFTMALGVTFPFNVVVGIPLYASIVERLWR